MAFDHRRLDVYRVSVTFVVVMIAEPLARKRRYLADQFRRAGTSIPLNIAEGSGEFSGQQKRRFYRIARRSAVECVAILDVLRAAQLGNEAQLAEALLDRITAMLTAMTKDPPKKPARRES
ncbi:MAG: four helix bundle protein [Longimicrobiales bacterium]